MSQKRPLYALKATVWVRIQRQTSGRKGKGVCLITGVDLDDAELTKLAAELKKNAAAAEQLKMGVIEIQGDKRDLLKSLLEAKGMKVKLCRRLS